MPDSPVLFAAGELFLALLELLILLPIDTVRKRLLVQSTKFENTSIRLCPVPYKSMWNCAWRIFHEEGGIKALYRGLKTRMSMCIIVACFHLLVSD